jgi:transposase
VDELLKEQAAASWTPALDGTPTANAALPPVQSPCPVCPFLKDLLAAQRERAYWKAMHQRAGERETKLKQQLAELEAKLRLREQRLFGRSTESSSSTVAQITSSSTTGNPTPRRRRGQQPGKPGHGRRDYSHLPATVEELTLSGAECCCPQCQLPFAALGSSEDTTILEIDVRAHRRIVGRRR